jgi:pSer/pThr/pTyr-binding forkhead associated (FHA) protein
MAKLVLSTGGTIVHQCFLEQERITVGREAGSGIVVDDPAVSRAHAAITAVGNDYILEDLGSVNGTIVNGAPVQRRILQHGDVIALGAFHLRYVNSKASSDIELERTMLISGLALSAIPARTDGPPVDPDDLHVPSARTPRAHFPNGYVTRVKGPRAGEAQELDRVVATFGAPRECVAVVTRRPRGYFVTHVEGRAHPRVNGQSIGTETRELREGDVIEAGPDKLQFHLR